jgi:hypothetical protein
MLKCAFDIAYPLVIILHIITNFHFIKSNNYSKTPRRFKRFTNIIKCGLPNAVNQWESDYQLHHMHDLIENYIYIVLQFGFVTLFVAAFPLGPLFALVFNVLAIRINARKLLCESR